jgi:hypothetical protein
LSGCGILFDTLGWIAPHAVLCSRHESAGGLLLTVISLVRVTGLALGASEYAFSMIVSLFIFTLAASAILIENLENEWKQGSSYESFETTEETWFASG